MRNYYTRFNWTISAVEVCSGKDDSVIDSVKVACGIILPNDLIRIAKNLGIYGDKEKVSQLEEDIYNEDHRARVCKVLME